MPRNKWKLRLRRKWRKKWKQTRGLHDKSAERGGGGAGGEGEWGQMKDSQISPLLLCRFSITWKSLIKLGKETLFCQQNQ